MFDSLILPILFPLAAVLALLAWMGWRFFYPGHFPTPRTKPAPRAEALPRHRLAWPRLTLALPRVSIPHIALAKALKPREGILWLILPLLMAASTVAITLCFSSHHTLEDLSRTGIGPEQEVGMILGEEKLVPPPALPPSTFVGTDRPNLETASRDWGLLDPRFTQILLRLFDKMHKRGYPMALLEGYRSPARQDTLAAKGPHVTLAKAFQSKHQFGLAADIAPMREGKLVISERDPWAAGAYQALGEEAAALRLVWGGNWKLHDLGHVEWHTEPRSPRPAPLP